MIRYQPVNGSLHDTSQRQSFGHSRLVQTVVIRTSDAADKAHWKIGALITQDIAPEKSTEIVDHQLVYLWQLGVTTDKG